MHSGIAIANALMAWPDGKGKLVGRKDVRPAMGFELARALPLAGVLYDPEQRDGGRFRRGAAANAANRMSPPNKSKVMPIEYQIQPSPRRLDQIIQTRSHRGARQRFTRRMTL